MNHYIVGLAIAFIFLAAADLRKHGWKRLKRPQRLSAGSLAVWVRSCPTGWCRKVSLRGWPPSIFW